MDKDQLNGRAETTSGAVKDPAGELVGPERLTAGGPPDPAPGF